MPSEKSRTHPKTDDHLTPALELLAAVSQMEADWLAFDDQRKTRRLVTEGLPLLDRVTLLFHRAEATTMAAWTMLQKASLMTDLAPSMGPTERTKFCRQAFVLVRESFILLSEAPAASFSTTTNLFSLMVETLIKIRDLFDDPGQRAELDRLIQGLSAQFGEHLARDLFRREGGADQLFTAQVLFSLTDLEDDPQTRQEMLAASQELALEAYDQWRASSVEGLTPAVSLLQALHARQVSVCPQCGAQSPPGTPFCSQCGARLREEVA